MFNLLNTYRHRREVVTSEAVAEEVRSRQPLSIIMSHVKQVSFKPGFKNCQWWTVKYCQVLWVSDNRCRV